MRILRYSADCQRKEKNSHDKRSAQLAQPATIDNIYVSNFDSYSGDYTVAIITYGKETQI